MARPKLKTKTPPVRHDDLDDEALVALAQEGDERALDNLLRIYRGFARQKARSYFLSGSEKEDVVQEGMIGLYKAIRDFRPGAGSSFASFAELCISRQIFSAIKYANRRKHEALNTSLSVHVPVEGDRGASLEDTLVAPALSDPAEMLVTMEDLDGSRESMSAGLTQLEGDVLRLFMEGKSYEEIAVIVGSHMKSIDNALQRIKRKLRNHLATRDAS